MIKLETIIKDAPKLSETDYYGSRLYGYKNQLYILKENTLERYDG